MIKPQVPVPNSSILLISYYRRFFDLDSETFFQKIQRALNPANKELSPVDGSDTELYGFIWITGTLIFLMFVSSTGSNILSDWLHPSKKHKYEYDFDLLTKSIGLFYGYNVIVPVLLYVYTTWVAKFPEPLSLPKLISIFGYTNLFWVPIAIANPIIVIFISNKKHHLLLNAIEWLIVVVSGAVTFVSNINKIRPIVDKNVTLLAESGSAASAKAIVGTLFVLHALFTVLVKVLFFGIV